MIRKVKPGDKFKPSAKVYNEMADACNKVNHGTASQREYNATAKPHALTVRAANKSDQNLNVGDVCWMESFVPGDFTSDLNLPKCGAYVNIYTGDETSGCLAVVTESMAPGHVGRVAISGLVECNIDEARLRTFHQFYKLSDDYDHCDSFSPVPNEKKAVPDVGGKLKYMSSFQAAPERAVVKLSDNGRLVCVRNTEREGHNFSRTCDLSGVSAGIEVELNPFHFQDGLPAMFERIPEIESDFVENERTPVFAVSGYPLYMFYVPSLPVHKGECFSGETGRIYICQKDVDCQDPSIVMQHKTGRIQTTNEGYVPVRSLFENLGENALTEGTGKGVYILNETTKKMEKATSYNPRTDLYAAKSNDSGIWSVVSEEIIIGTWSSGKISYNGTEITPTGEYSGIQNMEYDFYNGDTVTALFPSGKVISGPMDFRPGTILPFVNYNPGRGWAEYTGHRVNLPLPYILGDYGTSGITSTTMGGGSTTFNIEKPPFTYYIKERSPDM